MEASMPILEGHWNKYTMPLFAWTCLRQVKKVIPTQINMVWTRPCEALGRILTIIHTRSAKRSGPYGS